MRSGHRLIQAVATMVSLTVGAAHVSAQNFAGGDARWLDDCRNQGESRRRARFCDLRVMRLTGTAEAVSLDGRENGGVEIQGWDEDSIIVRAMVAITAATDQMAHDVAGQVRVVTSSGPIHAEGPGDAHDASWSVSYRISVPRHTNLTIQTINGPVSVEKVTGLMDLRAVNGPLDLTEVGGDVHARAQNGPLTVTLDGPRWDGAGLDAETRNGPVDLMLPKAYAAHLETGTANGPVTIDFPMTVQGRIDFQHLSTDIGGGGPPVRVVTTNGPLSVRQE
jgi:hypothetical protein